MTAQVPLLTIKVIIPSEAKEAFSEWQKDFNIAIGQAPGFVSLEINSSLSLKGEWRIIQRFANSQKIMDWKNSVEYVRLVNELAHLVKDPAHLSLEEQLAKDIGHSVAEVFVTQIHENKQKEYQNWIAKIQAIESKFPGFQAMYLQSPQSSQGKNWITFLHFDNEENLDRWLASQERQKILEEGKSLIASLESHRMISPYAGWFKPQIGEVDYPPVWKQTMVVLLMLFPVIMLEIIFLMPYLTNFNRAFSTFIGNLISVILLSWPLMPFAIRQLQWWLSPKNKKLSRDAAGIGLIIVFYLIEIAIFWGYFSNKT